MSRIDAGIILSGQQPNILARMEQGFDFGRKKRMANVMNEYGAGAMQGDQNAINALARFDVGTAQQARQGNLNASIAQQTMRHADANQALLDRQERRGVEEYARKISAEQRAAEAQRIAAGVSRATQAYSAGDLATVNQILQSSGEQPIQSLEEFPAIAFRYKEAGEILKNFRDFNAQPTETTAVQSLKQRASLAGLQEGTPEFQEFMRTGGRTPEYMSFETPEGFTFTQGAGGAPTPVTDVVPVGEMETPPGGGSRAFGLQGLIEGTINSVTDAVGAGEVFKETAEQQRFFRTMEEDMLVSLSQAYGRQPAQRLMERLRSLVPNVGSLEGSERAYGELEQLERRFMRDLNVMKRRLARTRRPTDIQALQSEMTGLEAALATLNEGKLRIRPAETGVGETASGIKWRVKQ